MAASSLPLFLGVTDAAKHLGIGRSKMYDLVAKGSIPSITIGNRRLVPVAALNELVNQALAGSQTAPATKNAPQAGIRRGYPLSVHSYIVPDKRKAAADGATSTTAS